MARGSIKSAGKGKWRIRLYLGEDSLGKQRYWNHTHEGKQYEAEAILAEKVLELSQTGDIIAKQKILIEKYLADWKTSSLKGSVSEKTFESYSWIIEKYITPEIGIYQLSKLTPATIQSFYNKMRSEYNLSPRTVRYAHSILRRALQQAVKWKMIPSNSCDLVTLPQQSKEEMKAMTQEQAKAFLKAAEGDRLKPLFETLIMTGMRYGEAYGLKWSDIDFKNNTISIKRALSRPRNTDWVLKEPKTKGSKRVIEVPEKTLDALRKQKAMIAAEKLKATEYTDNNFVFPNTLGQPLEHSKVVSRHFKPILEKAGLECFRPYDLRHTAATLLLQAGVPIKTVSERLGHSNASTTLNVYAHVLPGQQAEASEKMASIIY